LFVAGVIPGALLTVMLCGVTWYLARKRGYPPLIKPAKATSRNRSVWV